MPGSLNLSRRYDYGSPLLRLRSSTRGIDAPEPACLKAHLRQMHSVCLRTHRPSGPPPCDWYLRYSPRPTSIQNCGSWSSCALPSDAIASTRGSSTLRLPAASAWEKPQIAALERAETSSALFDERVSTAFVLADEVLANGRGTDHTFALARNLFSPRELVELLLLIGYFRMICGMMTTLDVEVESPFGAKVLGSLRDSAPGQPGQMH